MSVHVYLVNDLMLHDTADNSLTCWCCPRVEWANTELGYIYATALVIHNSADGREAVEQAEEIVNG